MFTTLVASNRKSRRRAMTPGTLILSTAFHGALLAGAVYASVRPPEEPEEPVELVTFLDVEDPSEPPPPVETVAAPPVGAPAFVPPLDPPPFIPAPDPTQPRIDISLYTGDIPTIDGPVTLPSAGPRAGDAPPEEASEDYTYQVQVLDSPPVVTNRAALGAVMEREYPRMLANAGIESEVIAEFVVLPNGTIDPTSVKVVSATRDGFEAATLKVLARLRFTPGRFRGEPVRVLTSLPIVWRVGGE